MQISCCVMISVYIYDVINLNPNKKQQQKAKGFMCTRKLYHHYYYYRNKLYC